MWVCYGLKVQELEKNCDRFPRLKESLQEEEVIRMDSGVKQHLRDDAVSPTIAPTGIDGSRGGRLGLGDGGGGGGGEERGEGIHLVSV